MTVQTLDPRIDVIADAASADGRNIRDWLDGQGIAYRQVDAQNGAVSVRMGRMTLSGPVEGLKRAIQDRLWRQVQS